MKKSEIYAKNNNDLRLAIINEIRSCVRQHKSNDITVEFRSAICYASGYDEQDESQIVEEVNEKEAIIYHRGDETERVALEHLSTEILIQILAGLESSLEEIKAAIK